MKIDEAKQKFLKEIEDAKRKIKELEQNAHDIDDDVKGHIEDTSSAVTAWLVGNWKWVALGILCAIAAGVAIAIAV